MKEKGYLSLLQLNTLLRNEIRHLFPDEVWVQAETSDVRIAGNGHCYLEFIQKEEHSNTVVAKARGMIWNNTFKVLRPYFERETGQAFVSGLKVLVQVRVEFNEIYGYGLVVNAIDPTYTIGDIVKRRKEILLRLKEEGVLTMNKELTLPILPQRIAVISSATAAGYGDFCDQLQANRQGFRFEVKLFPALMQGEGVQDSIIAALDRIYEASEQWDVVVIIRGGGATSDLAGFDTYPLAASVAQYPLPIITGIGHERDDTVIDLIAHTRVKTPTAAAEFLIAKMEEAETRLFDVIQSLTTQPVQRLEREKQRLSELTLRIPQVVLQTIHRQERRFIGIEQQMKYRWQTRMQYELHRLQVMPRIQLVVGRRLEREKAQLTLLEHRTEALSPQRLLQHGYSLTLKNGKAVRSVEQLTEGEHIETHFADGSIESIINHIKPNQS